jgi:hypothetical protein
LGNKRWIYIMHGWGEDYYKNPKNAGQLAWSSKDVRFWECKALQFENNVLGCLPLWCKCVKPH